MNYLCIEPFEPKKRAHQVSDHGWIIHKLSGEKSLFVVCEAVFHKSINYT